MDHYLSTSSEYATLVIGSLERRMESCEQPALSVDGTVPLGKKGCPSGDNARSHDSETRTEAFDNIEEGEDLAGMFRRSLRHQEK